MGRSHHVVFFVVLLLRAVGSTHADEFAPPDTHFEPYALNPVLAPDPTKEDAWDAGAIGSVSLVKVGDVFHLYYEAWALPDHGGGLNFSSLQIGHATSADGIHWDRDPNNPVVGKGARGEWDADGTWDPFVIFEEGKFKLWYGGGIGTHCDFGYAESNDGSRFQKCGRISREGQLSDQHVIRDPSNGSYRMYYFDKRHEPRAALFAVESPDEMRFDFSAAKPIQIDGEFADKMVKFSQVFTIGDTWYMAYANFTRPHAANSTTRLAKSSDGVRWRVVNQSLFDGHDAEILRMDDAVVFAYFSPRGMYNHAGGSVSLAVFSGQIADLCEID